MRTLDNKEIKNLEKMLSKNKYKEIAQNNPYTITVAICNVSF